MFGDSLVVIIPGIIRRSIKNSTPEWCLKQKNLTTPAYNLAILYVYSRVVLAATSALSLCGD